MIGAVTPKRLRRPLDVAKVARFERFCARHLRHMKGRFAGQPFVLEDWQRDLIAGPLLGTMDADGLRQYREAYIELPRKQGKSTLGAALALYLLLADGEYGGEVYSVAASRDQARIVFDAAKAMIGASPMLAAATKAYRSVIEVPETGSIYRVLSADADLQHGLNPSAAIVDELHVHPNLEQWEALTSGTAARSQPLIMAITTPGAARSGPAWEVRQRLLQRDNPRLYGFLSGAEDDDGLDDRQVWRSANPASWVQMDYLEDQYRKLPPSVFERLHLGRWPTGDAVGAAIPRAMWDACAGTPDLHPDNGPCVIAVDAASKRDTTAVALIQRHPDGVNHVRLWSFAADRQMGYLDYTEVEDLLRELCSTFEVSRLAFDPFQMVRTQQILAAEGLPAETFPQSDQRMVPACSLLFDVLQERRLVHDGDPELGLQVMNAGIRETPRGWRFEKRKSSGPIDALVALTIGVQVAEWEAELGQAPSIMLV